MVSSKQWGNLSFGPPGPNLELPRKRGSLTLDLDSVCPQKKSVSLSGSLSLEKVLPSSYTVVAAKAWKLFKGETLRLEVRSERLGSCLRRKRLRLEAVRWKAVGDVRAARALRRCISLKSEFTKVLSTRLEVQRTIPLERHPET